MTDITYNGVLIRSCVTREFDQESIYDQSGTDHIATRYKIGVEGYIHSQASISSGGHGIQSPDAPVAGAVVPTVQFDRVSALLLEPRRAFSMSWEGNQVLAAVPHPGVVSSPNTDVNNGPHPRGLAVINVTPSAIRVRWSIEFTLSGCAGESLLREGPYKVINNRWGIAEGRDTNMFTTRRISGTIRFAEGISAKHAFIAFVVPGLEKGFRRESFEFEQSPNGLEATYSIVDRQIHTAAPWPATSMDVSTTRSTNDGLTWVSECQVTLRGSPEADRRLLLQRMIQIMDQRTGALEATNEDALQYLIENIVITEHDGEENLVNGMIAIREMPAETRIVLGNLVENHLGKPLELPSVDGEPAPYDPAVSRVPALHGYNPQGGTDPRSPAFLFLLNCYHQDPCSPHKAIFRGNQQGSDQTAEQDSEAPPYPTEVPSGTLQAGDTSKYTQAHFTATFLSARMSNRYCGDRLRVILPIATANTNGATATVGTLGAGIGRRVVWFDAERIGDWPQIVDLPATYSREGSTGYLLRYWLQPQPPALSVDGNKRIYRVLVKAVYGLDRLPDGKLFGGMLPHVNLQAGDGTFDQSQYKLASIGP